MKEILELVMMVLPILKPSEVERLKTAIRKQEEENEKKKKKLVEAVAHGDVDSINALLFGD